MTTREYILNQAKSTYEKLARSSFDINRCTVDIAKFTNIEKAKILFNHLYFEEIPIEYRENILQYKNYRKIISHKNSLPPHAEIFPAEIVSDNLLVPGTHLRLTCPLFKLQSVPFLKNNAAKSSFCCLIYMRG